ncbi:mannose-6-phosphate isomerase type 1 [Arthrobacter sp. AG258]|uniref:mannose-6-phosphate isomerase, class I n=1 Tax=Arthrobacter sp. AG258 TaxID=2183899 RepID=UPI0010611D21|nr:mannose-6-phosphate isomerase, class I [Arthrobacter sp. AG258]TDT74662.1 mannose-6-phosphate isomerase type 1 [Arthrobacter sp. AG258]
MYRLTGTRRSYDWGSATAMFEFLDTTPDGAPFAELWLGAHPTGPATAQTPGGPEPLDHVISTDTEQTLGKDVSARFGQLPYLVKLLAPARPLSMQVHPNRHMAAAGYRDEERRGVLLTDPTRSFKDEHNKPEMVYAVTHFEGLVGFRDREEVSFLLHTIAGPLDPARNALQQEPGEQGLRSALELMLNLDTPQVVEILQTAGHLAGSHPEPLIRSACATMEELSQLYPGDIGAIISLMLNRVKLQPGQLVFLADGVPHAYLGGFGLEVMGNSDNVLRLGLTTKHIDVASMLKALDFTASGFTVETAPSDQITHIFEPPTPEYALSITHPHLAPGGTTELPGHGPRVLVCLSGQVTVQTTAGNNEKLSRGQALFVPATEKAIRVGGCGSMAQTFVPEN